MTIELPTLPYDFAALEPAMSTNTPVFHLSHHQRGDFDRIAPLLRGTELNVLPVEVGVTVSVSIANADIKHRHLSLVKYMAGTTLEKSPIRRAFMAHVFTQRNWVWRFKATERI